VTVSFFDLHADLPREGPGLDNSTRRALAMTGMSGALDIIDMGCGPGAQSVVLLDALPEARVTGIDTHAPFLAEARRRAAAAGHAARFTAIEADMAAPPLSDACADLIWCEGAIYIIGVVRALRLWRRLLRPGGMVVFSDAVWTTRTPSAEAREIWADYPEMTTIGGVRARIVEAGYRNVGGFLLPEEAWDAYYGPLSARERRLREEFGDAPVLAEARAEIAARQAFGYEFGYAMFIASPAAA